MATILLVDDYPPNHRLMRFVFEHRGHTVISAFDGHQALDRLADCVVDVVITDLTMPIMDGRALARQIRANAHYHDLPIIIVTGNSDSRNQAWADLIGVNSLFTRPVASDDLIQKVEQLVLVRDATRREAAPTATHRKVA